MIPQDYPALSAIWSSVAGDGITAKLASLNGTVVTPASEMAPAVYWPEANGWDGPINQNDLVVATIITDDGRKAWEANPT